jgi:hypothetical protein
MWRLAICGRYTCVERRCAAAFAAVLFLSSMLCWFYYVHWWSGAFVCLLRVRTLLV